MPRPTPTATKSRAAAPARQRSEGSVRFSLQNWILLLAGLVSIVVGYVLLNGGSTSLAAGLLVLGYVVLVPLGIIR
ncbi:MAG TPA: hypothetical protein VHG28_16535 [Longimicrobiaceae bacterium]|nr:hypothetical protein [Longimicrobiaceae bacterium]